jgi:hypothetical protein
MPVSAPQAPGLVLVGPERCRRGEECLIHGAFRIETSGDPGTPSEAHRALALAVTSLHEDWTLDPFRQSLLFEDDLRRDARGATGEFVVDLAVDGGFRHPGRYYVTASLGRHTSNTVVIDVA